MLPRCKLPATFRPISAEPGAFCMLNRQLCRKTAVSNLLGLVPAVLLLGTLMSCGGGSNTSGGGTQPPPTTGSVKIALAQIAAGFINPLGIEQSDDNTGRFFVVEQ